MKIEPYINKRDGRIEWLYRNPDGLLMEIENCDINILARMDWKPYADFERNKLGELADKRNQKNDMWCPIGDAYAFKYENDDYPRYVSSELIGYNNHDFCDDSESHRFFKRAEFLKAVCEKEGAGWLPTIALLKETVSQFECGCSFYSCPVFRGATSHCPCKRHSEPVESAGKVKTCYMYATDGKAQCYPRCDICGKCTLNPERDYYTNSEIDELKTSVPASSLINETPTRH